MPNISRPQWGDLWHLRSQRAVVVLAAALTLGMSVLVVSNLAREHDYEVRAAGKDTQNLTRILEEHARQSLRRVELSLSQSAELLRGSANAAVLDPIGTHTRLQALLPKDGLLRALTVVDRKGTVVASTTAESSLGLPSVANLDYFALQRDQMDSGLVFGAAIKSRNSGQWVIPVSMRLGTPGEGFDGVLMGALEPGYFHRFYESIDTGPDGFITLFSRQGWILARAPVNEALLGRNWASAPMFSEHLPTAEAKTVRQVVAADGIERVYSYRALKEYPVVVSLGLSLTDALTPWRARAWAAGMVLALVLSALWACTLALVRQLHRRHVAESALKLSELSVQTASVPTFWIAANGRIIRVNKAACDLHGYTEAQLLTMSISDLDPDFPPERWPAHWAELRARKRMCFETTQVNRNGHRFPVEVDLNFVEFEGQEYNFSFTRDISARTATATALVKASDDALAASRAKSQFLATMSHEIRTPMNAVLGMLKLLQRTELSARQRDYASKTEAAAKSLLGLLNDILDFSKIDAGKLELNVQAFSMDALLRDLSFIVSASVGNKPVEVLFDVGPDVPKHLIGDALRLQQVLINLSGNAIKFTAKGEVVIQIKLLAREGSRATLRFAVVDSGIGIAPENQLHIFEGFSQAEASTTRRFGGTGLGLSISRRLVDMMGGELKVKSVLGQGSTFHFTLTLGVTDETTSLDGEDGADANGGEVPFNVLVVDDNTVARDLHVAMAESLGWHVDAAATGAQALQLVEARRDSSHTPYQAILTDWEMPGMDGWDTITNILDLSPERNAPITVMVTAHGREMLSQRSAQEQARLHAFLVKPVTSSMLSDAVSEARMGRSSLRSLSRAPAEKVASLQGMRVLVVEDNLVSQQVAKELLEAEGAIVALAENGRLGVAAVASASPPFDAVLMDIQMPVMDGYAATQAIRQGLGRTHLPIIAMTANAMTSDREACLAVGMNDHLGKPFELDQLVALLLVQTGRVDTAKGAAVYMRYDPSAPTASAVPPPTAAPKQADGMPAVDAIDVESALKRMGGKSSLYERTLQAFLAELVTLPDQFDALLQAGQVADATRLLHTLKGVSATVGAGYLAAFAKTMEAQVKVAEPATDTLQWRAEFRSAVGDAARVLGDVAARFAAPPQGQAASSAQPAANYAQALADLGALQAALEDDDMAAMELYAPLRQAHAALGDPAFAPLDQAMADLDFGLAATHCKTLMGTLNSIH